MFLNVVGLTLAIALVLWAMLRPRRVGGHRVDAHGSPGMPFTTAVPGAILRTPPEAVARM